MPTRISKIVLLISVALYATLVAFSNITDYDSNYQFVHHVLLMDTTFEGNKAMWRAIHSPTIYHIAYILIIATECLVAILAWVGVVQLWKSRQSALAFNQHKTFAIYALLLGITLWFTGFIVIGGEWFLMWQSQQWNGIQSAFRIAIYFTLVLVFISMKDSED